MTGRPPLGLRVGVAVLALLILIGNTALLLSDRAPRVLRALFGPLSERITERLDGNGRAGAALDAQNVGSDSIVHFGLWAVATLMVGLAVWSWYWLLPTAVAVFAASVAIEIGQGRYSTSRNVEFRDVVFNGLGVAAGTTAVAVCLLVGTAIASTRRRHDLAS